MTTSKLILLSYLASMNRHTFSMYEKCLLYLLLAIGVMAKELVGEEEVEGEGKGKEKVRKGPKQPSLFGTSAQSYISAASIQTTLVQKIF